MAKCLFSWISVTKSPGCLGSLFGQKEVAVWEPQPCMGPNCQLWDAQQNNCGLITKKA